MAQIVIVLVSLLVFKRMLLSCILFVINLLEGLHQTFFNRAARNCHCH